MKLHIIFKQANKEARVIDCRMFSIYPHSSEFLKRQLVIHHHDYTQENLDLRDIACITSLPE